MSKRERSTTRDAPDCMIPLALGASRLGRPKPRKLKGQRELLLAIRGLRELQRRDPWGFSVFGCTLGYMLRQVTPGTDLVAGRGAQAGGTIPGTVGPTLVDSRAVTSQNIDVRP